MEDFTHKLAQDFPGLSFQTGTAACWSPKQQHIVYNPDAEQPAGFWSLLHEVGHALLKHNNYSSDFELLTLEVAAWEKARLLAQKYDQEIDEAHIERCLDTYRDWLHKRSACPVCKIQSIQTSATDYRCFNCGAIWHVSASRFCRPYRKTADDRQLTVDS